MNHLFQLFAQNKSIGNFSVEAKAGDKEATVYLYDMIVGSDAEAEWCGGVSPQAFIKALKSIDAPTIHLRVNSPGGNVFAGRAIEQAIREHPSNIVAHVDGLAASAASIVIMAADTVKISQGGFIMIHNAHAVTGGNAADLRKQADLLSQVDAGIVKTYVAKTGQSEEVITAWMNEEKWLSADESVSLGFADELSAAASVENNAKQWDVSTFKNPPVLASLVTSTSDKLDPVETVNRDDLKRSVLRALIPS